MCMKRCQTVPQMLLWCQNVLKYKCPKSSAGTAKWNWLSLQCWLLCWRRWNIYIQAPVYSSISLQTSIHSSIFRMLPWKQNSTWTKSKLYICLRILAFNWSVCQTKQTHLGLHLLLLFYYLFFLCAAWESTYNIKQGTLHLMWWK